jgi:hypothetical protein
MNLFNQFNCRIVDEGKYNIFAGLWRNIFFILVVAFEFALTWFMVDIGATTLGSSLIGTANIDGMDHLAIWLIGSTVFLWGAVIKKIPLKHFEKISEHINLEDPSEDDKLSKMFGKASELHNKARRSIGVAGHDEKDLHPIDHHEPQNSVDESGVPDDDDYHAADQNKP